LQWSCIHLSFIGRMNLMVGLTSLHHFQLIGHQQLGKWASTWAARCQMAIWAWQWIPYIRLTAPITVLPPQAVISAATWPTLTATTNPKAIYLQLADAFAAKQPHLHANSRAC
jgi:hypothetical protein